MIGKQLGSFLIESKIGAGAMGEVYRARHVKTGKPAAVKVIVGPYAQKGNAADRFEREAEILQQFRHPNIVRFLAVGRSKGISYFAMEFVEGETLEQLLARKEFLSWQETLDLASQLCQALQYSHEHGVVHRDLKPSNVMVTADGVVKLTDFGIAKDLDATALTAPNRTLGTAAYMAPEQIRGTPEVSHKTDLYALGCVLHQMITGQTPFRGATPLILMRAHAEEPPPRPSEKTPQIPRAMDNLVLKLMAKSPAERPWDAQAVATELSNLQEKLNRGESIRMVFGEPFVSANASFAATQAEAGAAPKRPARGTEAATTEAPKKRKSAKRAGDARKVPAWSTVGMVMALVGLVGLAVYLLRPKSMEQLYNESKPLIDSKDYGDWETAEMRLDELEKRFPDHPYKKDLEDLHGKVALYKARGRARWLEGGRVKPQNEVETAYFATFTTAEEALKSRLDHLAVQSWLRFALELQQQNNPALRGWVLLGQERAKDLATEIERARRQVTERLDQARLAADQGETALADRLYRSITEEFGQYGYLSDLVGVARSSITAEAESNEHVPDDSIDGGRSGAIGENLPIPERGSDGPSGEGDKSLENC
jgi:serine/threonine-protein kinase